MLSRKQPYGKSLLPIALSLVFIAGAMRVDAFDFHLPEDRIAQRPASPRDSARLLQIRQDGLSDLGIRDLPRLLTRGDLLVFNDTRVIPARLMGERRGIGVSVTLHQPLSADTWRAFAKPAKRLRPDDVIMFGDGFEAAVVRKSAEGDVTLRFNRTEVALRDALQHHGAIPLPPYIRGGIADERDRSDYQTLFAREEGAVAAPTAALHFTPDLMAAIEARGIRTSFVTLHVGAGTFLPVKADDTEDHKMHTEWGSIGAEAARAISDTRRNGGKIVAVGTTSLRLIESAADAGGTVHATAMNTDIFITPGYRFRAVDRLLTNFHLPRSTLFMLVSAFAGLDRMKVAYAHAVDASYRFYSYGDCCLLDLEPPR